MSVQMAEDNRVVVAKVLASVGEIATLPEVTAKIFEVVEDPEGTAGELKELIKRDPTLSAKILKLVNSAFYALHGRVSDINRAIVLLGRSAVRNMAIAVSIAHMFKGKQEPESVSSSDLWRHCFAVAVAAKKMAFIVGGPVDADGLFLAGLIHDLGLIVERQAMPQELAEICRRYDNGEGDFLKLEREIIGATHQDFGYALATQWRFPDHLRAGVGFHHGPGGLTGEYRYVATILQCADTLCCRDGFGFGLTARTQEFALELLDSEEIPADMLVQVRDGLGAYIEEAELILGLNC